MQLSTKVLAVLPEINHADSFFYFPFSEFEEFKGYFKKAEVFKFEPTKELLEKYKDGGVAIIDQWIAAHAR